MQHTAILLHINAQQRLFIPFFSLGTSPFVSLSVSLSLSSMYSGVRSSSVACSGREFGPMLMDLCIPRTRARARAEICKNFTNYVNYYVTFDRS